MFVVVSYDVVSDKRRNRISKLMLNYGKRVQRSVFECNLNPDQLKRMVRQITGVYQEKEDTIRVYSLCEGCVPRAQTLGVGELTHDELVYVV